MTEMSLPHTKISTHSSCLTLILKLKPLHNHSSSSSSNSTLKQDSISGSNDDNYPTGDFEFKPLTGFDKFIVKLRMLMADSSEHVQHGSVLKITLRGKGNLLSNPVKFVDVYTLYLSVTLVLILSGVYDNHGIEPQVERIGKYKMAGDRLICKTMSEDHREMLTALLDNISSNWLDKVSSARGKKREDVENFINEGVYQVARLKEEGFITSILYHDEVVKELIAVIRASGTISSVGGKEKFNYEKLYEMIGFNKEVISRGKYAELFAADHRSFRPHEAELFAKRAQNIYEQFRDKAALSRSMTVDKMEEVAQGRVWTGKDAVSHGLVDAIGGCWKPNNIQPENYKINRVIVIDFNDK
ncbi:unnamed protein product [Trifolium pratense]|uniref:Uncharacterized protein n=1 Tax=Trifolium pratense TaxID=57577 RepID=A0ACB0L8C6_TRIPR|nr:unnamed protein product [Trifolium pratense]